MKASFNLLLVLPWLPNNKHWLSHLRNITLNLLFHVGLGREFCYRRIMRFVMMKFLTAVFLLTLCNGEMIQVRIDKNMLILH